MGCHKRGTNFGFLSILMGILAFIFLKNKRK